MEPSAIPPRPLTPPRKVYWPLATTTFQALRSSVVELFPKSDLINREVNVLIREFEPQSGDSFEDNVKMMQKIFDDFSHVNMELLPECDEYVHRGVRQLKESVGSLISEVRGVLHLEEIMNEERDSALSIARESNLIDRQETTAHLQERLRDFRERCAQREAELREQYADVYAETKDLMNATYSVATSRTRPPINPASPSTVGAASLTGGGGEIAVDLVGAANGPTITNEDNNDGDGDDDGDGVESATEEP